MDVAAEIRRLFKAFSDRQWSETGSDIVAPDVRHHAPALGVEATSWDEALAGIRATVESLDARYEVDDVVEHGPLVVAFISATGTLDGRAVAWSACTVSRMEDGKVVEIWTLRGSDPRPVDAS